MSHTDRNRVPSVVALFPDRAPRPVRRGRLCRARRVLTIEALEARTLPSFLPPIYYDAPLNPGTVAVGDSVAAVPPKAAILQLL